MVNDLMVVERSPQNEVSFGQKAAKALMEVVKEKRLSRKFGGEKEHIFVEGWQMLAQFSGLTPIVTVTEPMELDGVKGFHAVAELRDESQEVVSRGEAFCMRDEPNWRNKPTFQLASMAQTRAISKVCRNKLAWIATMAGYAGTPAEEMDGVYPAASPNPPQEAKKGKPKATPSPPPESGSEGITESQKQTAVEILGELGQGRDDCEAYLGVKYEDWTLIELGHLREWFKQLKNSPSSSA